MTTITIILKILPYVLCAGIPSFFFIKNNVKKNKKYKDAIENLTKLNKQLVDAEKAKGAVRSEYGNKEDAIVNNPAVAPGVMPVHTEGIHNHKHNVACSKGCPAYSGD